MPDYGIIAALGAIVALDTTVAGQFMVSQPLVSSALAGFFLGDMESGIIIGSIMQLMWLKLIPAGGTIFLNGNLGTLAAVSVVEISINEFSYSIEALRFTAILYGIITSYIFGYFTTHQRRINLSLINLAHKSLDHGHIARFRFFHFSGVLLTGIAGMVLAVFFAYLGKFLLFHIPSAYFSILASYFTFGLYAFWGIGIGTVFSMIWMKKSWRFPLIGFCAGLIVILLL